MQRKDTWRNIIFDRSWVSIVPCKKGKAKWEARLHIYVGAGQRLRELRRRSPHGGKAKSEQWGRRLLRRMLEENGLPPADAAVSVELACSRWIDTQASDIENKRRHLRWLQRVWGDDTPICELSHEQIVGVPAKLRRPLGATATARSRKRRGNGSGRRRKKGTGLGVSTVASVCKTGNRLLAFAAKMGWCAAATIPVPAVPLPDAEWFTIDEFAALRDVAEPPWRLAYMLGARAGLRRGEIVEVRNKDVDLDQAKIRVRRAYKLVEGEWIIGPPKNGKPRTVPIPPDLVAELRKVQGSREQLVVMRNGERIPPPLLTAQVAKDAEKAGIGRPGVGAHTLRHSFCSHYAQGGAASKQIQALAGHASLRTTERYMHLAPSDVEQALAFLPAVPDAARAGNFAETNDESAR